MLHVNWKMAIGFGLLLWIIMFAVASVAVAFKVIANTGVHALFIVLGGVIAFVLAGKVRPTNVAAALAYGASWVVISVVLDAFITMRFNSGIFREWSIWVGNLVVLLIPLLRVTKSGGQTQVS